MIICIAMRYGSKRLPGKALIDLGGKNSIEMIINQLSSSRHQIVICCPEEEDGDPIYNFATSIGARCYRGSLENVLERMVSAAESFSSESFIRVTGDDLFVDPIYLDALATSHSGKNADITFSDLPKGTESLVIKTSFGRKLLKSYGDSTEYWDRKRSPAWENAKINFSPLSPIPADDNTFALELDTKEDLEVIKKVIKKLELSGVNQPFYLDDLIKLHSIDPFPHSRDPVDRTYFDS